MKALRCLAVAPTFSLGTGDMSKTGVVKNWNDDKGFGFIGASVITVLAGTLNASPHLGPQAQTTEARTCSAIHLRYKGVRAWAKGTRSVSMRSTTIAKARCEQ